MKEFDKYLILFALLATLAIFSLTSCSFLTGLGFDVQEYQGKLDVPGVGEVDVDCAKIIDSNDWECIYIKDGQRLKARIKGMEFGDLKKE